MNNYCYDYPRPALTVDIVLFSFIEDKLGTLLIQRGQEPFKGMWAYPGGFVDETETAEQASRRELWEETGVHNVPLEQLFTDTELNRDPRGWIISVVFFACAPHNTIIQAGDDAANVKWFPISSPPNLVFGHELFLKNAIDKCRHQMQNNVFGKELLPDVFKLKALYKLYLQLIDIPEQIEKVVARLIKHGVLIQIGEEWHFEEGRYEAVLKTGFF